MEIEGATNRRFTVCLYEVIGTAILLYAILVSNSLTGGIFSLMIGICLAAPISGAHFNPAITLAIYF
jgi:glycerol uptake facilitator-like aquaporin